MRHDGVWPRRFSFRSGRGGNIFSALRGSFFRARPCSGSKPELAAFRGSAKRGCHRPEFYSLQMYSLQPSNGFELNFRCCRVVPASRCELFELRLESPFSADAHTAPALLPYSCWSPIDDQLQMKAIYYGRSIHRPLLPLQIRTAQGRSTLRSLPNLAPSWRSSASSTATITQLDCLALTCLPLWAKH